MLIQGIYISGKACQIEADKSRNDSKTLQHYKRHVEHVSWVKNTCIDSCDSSYHIKKSCQYKKRCKTFVLTFVHCTAIIWIAFKRV